MANCAGCGAPMKHIEAGVSKSTGKPYDAFDACSEKCGFRPSKEQGVRKVVVESQKPSQVPHPSNGNELRERTMVMSYAKDIVCALLARDQIIGAPAKETIAIFRELISELTNPMKGV